MSSINFNNAKLSLVKSLSASVFVDIVTIGKYYVGSSFTTILLPLFLIKWENL